MGWRDSIKKEESPSGGGGGGWRSSIKKEAEPEFNLKSYAKPFVENLPTYGAAAGGLIGGTAGAPAMGVGAAPGAMIGAGAGGLAGTTLKSLINEYVYDEAPDIDAPLRETVQSMAGEGLGMAGGKAIDAAGRGLVRLSGELSSVPQKSIETFLSRNPKVMGLVEKYGDDLNAAANDIRGGYQSSIKGFKDTQNSNLSSALANSGKRANLGPVMADLQAGMSRLNPITDDAARSEMGGLIDKIRQVERSANPNVMGPLTAAQSDVPLSDINAVKRMLQEATDYGARDSALARSSVANSGTAKAATRAKRVLDAASPEAAEANKNLSALHRASRKTNKNLFEQGAPDASLFAAGSGRNQKAANDLRAVGDVIDADLLSQAEELAAAKYLGNAGILPDVMTGRSMAPLLLGAGDSARSLYEGDVGGAARGLGVAALGSPWALKQALRARILQERVAPEILKIPLRVGAQEAVRGGQ